MNKQSISVVIPAYNCANTINDSIDSIYAQTAFEYIKEIVIVNDGSTDETVEQITKKSKELEGNSIIKLVSQKNCGVSTARNNGIKVSLGEWIALLDSDDVWLPSKLEKQIAIINSYSNCSFVGTGSNYSASIFGGKKIDTLLFKGTIKSFCLKFYPVTPSALFKKEIFDNIGGFDETMKYGEDGEFFSRIIANYGYYYIAENLVDCGHGKRAFGEKGLSSNLKEMQKSNVEIIRRLKKRKEISVVYFLFLRIFYFLKYLRRKILSH